MIYTFDKNQNLIGTYDEKEELTVANLNLKINKAATLDLEFPANKENVNNLKNVVFLAVPYPNNKQKLLFLRVMTRTDKEYTIELMAKEFAYQELATSGYIEDKRFKDANAKTLISGAVQGSGYTVSNVNVSGTAQLNFYYEDYLTAVSDVIEALGGEVIFYVTLSGNKISGRYVDYVIAQGTNTSKTFAYGSNLISVERQSDASEVYTAILPRGKGELVSTGEDDAPDGYGRRINIAEILWKKPTNPLDKPVGSLVLEDPTATAAFGQANGTARILLKTYEDIEDKNELINAAYRDLMQYNHPATQFTASVANIGDSALGDTIVIMHSERGMSYRTRIFEIDYDLIEINNTVATFGDNLSKNNTSNMLTSVSRAINNVKETANFAVASANGIGNNYYGENEPANPKNGDTWFYTAGDGFGIRQYVDGQWVEYVNSKTSEQITQQVETAIANAKEYANNLNATQTQATNSVASDLAKKADELTKNQQSIASQASAYTDSAVADANAKAVEIGQTTAQNAQKALDEAKKDFTSSFASQASQTASMASEANSKASQYASQAKLEAVSAAASADGVVRTEFKSTTDSMTTTIQQNKSDADGKISTAQTTATQALDGLATKVSQTEYNAKTGQLQTDLTTTTQTADQAKTDIVSIKQKDGEQDEKMNSIVSDVSGTKQTVSNIQTKQGEQSASITNLQTRADGIEADVTELKRKANKQGQVNQLFNTEFSPDFSGWYDRGLHGKDIKASLGAPINGSNVIAKVDGSPTRLQSEPIAVTAGMKVSYSVNKLSSITLWSYLNCSDKDGNIINVPNTSSNEIAGASRQNTGFIKIENITIPDGVSYISLGLLISSIIPNGDLFQQPMLVFDSTVGDYVQGTYSNSVATAKAQLTADTARSEISNYKTDADGRISKAQSDITQTANQVATKVSQSDYNAKTGELTSSVNKAQQTADSATQTIGTYKESNDKRVTAAETNIKANSEAIELTASKTELDQVTGKLSGDISTLQQRADGFDATVTKVDNLSLGGRNLYLNSRMLSDSYGMNNVQKVTVEPFDSTTNMWHIVAPQGSSNRSGIYLFKYADSKIPNNSDWSYSADIKGTGKVNIFGLEGASVITTKGVIGNTWSRISQTGHVNAPQFKTIVMYFDTTNSPLDVYIKLPKLEIGNVATDWTPAPEDVDTQLAQVKITADGVYKTVNNPQTGLNTRVSTAEGNINEVKDSVGSMSNTVTETADGLTREIADRKTGDSNTLQAGKDFTTSRITSYDTGMQSRLAQVSDGIMATVSSTNLVVDSSFVNGTDNWNKYGEGEWKIDVNNTYYGVRFIAFNNFNHAGKYAYLTSQKIYKNTIAGKNVFVSVDVNVANVDSTDNNYAEVYVIQEDSSGKQLHWNTITQQLKSSTNGWKNFRTTVDIDSNASSIYLGYQAVGNVEVYIARPYVGFTELPVNGYVTGPSSNNTTQLSLFYDSFSLGIQKNTGALISGINGDSSSLNIASNKISISGDTTFIGNNFMDGAIIKNASIGSAQIAKASITDANIVSLNVDKLSGNISNFIQSNWNGQYGSTTIDANGMNVDTNGVNTRFGSSGMTLNMTGESIGGIGVQGFAGKPSNYQGLTFWLDGNAEYMAWGARDSGVTSGNPITKLGWFRSGSNPIGTSAGFNFDDDVYFGQGINVQGASTQKLKFGTQNFNNYNYPYFGNPNNQAGFAFGGVATYLIAGTTYYNMSKVIEGLAGLGAVKIPSEINSDGTVKKWFNVTL